MPKCTFNDPVALRPPTWITAISGGSRTVCARGSGTTTTTKRDPVPKHIAHNRVPASRVQSVQMGDNSAHPGKWRNTWTVNVNGKNCTVCKSLTAKSCSKESEKAREANPPLEGESLSLPISL